MYEHLFSQFLDKWVHPDYRPVPVAREELDRVEAIFETRLPKTYRSFIEGFGPASVGGSLLFSIVDQNLFLDDLSEFFGANEVIEVTTSWRKIGLPDSFVAFAAQGAGDMFCFEVVSISESAPEDAVVWYFNHEEGDVVNLEMEFIPWFTQYVELRNTGTRPQ